MNKDQFWQIIAAVNANAPYADEETHLCKVQEALSRHSLTDIMDWYLIMEEYSKAAYRNDLWAASAALDGRYTDDGFAHFRFWLISRGKEVYMNALQDPESLASVPRTGKKILFERFAYAPYHAYETKLIQMGHSPQEDLFCALKQYTLAEETVAEIRAELPQRPDIQDDWTEWMLPKLFPTICKAREPKDIEGLLNTSDLVFGYVYQGVECTEYVFQNTPEHLANFIGSHPEASRIIVTNEMDWLILDTVGWFIDRCPSQELLKEVKKTLIPIQRGEADAQPFFCPTMDEMEEYCKEKQNAAKKPLVGRVTFVNGEAQEFTDVEEYIQCICMELPYHATTGFRYETLTDDPTVRKAVDDILHDLYGEDDPHPLEDHENKPEQGMTMGGLT